MPHAEGRLESSCGAAATAAANLLEETRTTLGRMPPSGFMQAPALPPGLVHRGRWQRTAKRLPDVALNGPPGSSTPPNLAREPSSPPTLATWIQPSSLESLPAADDGNRVSRQDVCGHVVAARSRDWVKARCAGTRDVPPAGTGLVLGCQGHQAHGESAATPRSSAVTGRQGLH